MSYLGVRPPGLRQGSAADHFLEAPLWASISICLVAQALHSLWFCGRWGPSSSQRARRGGDTPGVLVPTLHFLLFASAWVSGPELL